MSEAAQELLKTFDRLPASVREEVYYEILKRSQQDYPPLDDETFALIADETFQMYDADEAAHGKG